MKKMGMNLISVVLAVMLTFGSSITAYATNIENIQNEIDDLQKDINDLEKEKNAAENAKNAAQSQLSGVNSQISSITGAMGDLGMEIDAASEDLVGLLTAIDMIEADIENKTQEIAETQIKYDAAVEEQDNQYAAMKIRVKYMYEQGDMSYLSIFLESASLADAINKADYIEELYVYDREMLIKYQEAVAYTKQVWDELEEQKSELETSKIELQEEQAELETILAQLQVEYDNYDVMLAQAKKQAASYTAKINQQTNEIRKLEKAENEKKKQVAEKKKEAEEAKIKAEQEAARKALENGDIDTASKITEDNNNNKGGSTPSTPQVIGSGTGSQVASYALQFVGNPYVAGGTSLTNGADCSGFVMSVYSHFGYKLPRTSYSQSTVGRSVSYSEAQPGDIIYYGGHVGIYIGNGQIVHASTERTGIKVSPATYRGIVSIRRVI